MLIEKGAELEAVDSDGDTVLGTAAVGGDPTVVQMLIDEGAKLETKNKKGESALDMARKYGNREAAAVIQAAQKVFLCLWPGS